MIVKGKVNDLVFVPVPQDRIEVRIYRPNGDYYCGHLSDEDASRLVEYIQDLKATRKLVREEHAINAQG